MAITYRNSGDWGAGKGSKLTSVEADTNFWTLQQLIDDLNSTGGLVSWDSATISGNVLTFHKTDGSTSSVIIPSVAPTWRGEWAPSTSYAVYDWFWESSTSAVYSVLIAHESATSFDSGEMIGGLSIYQKILDLPDQFATPATITASTYTLLLADAGTFNTCTNAGGCVVTIPLDSETEFETGSEFHFCQDTGAGAISFDYATGLNLKYPTDRNPVTNMEGSVITIKKVAADTWRLFGRLEAASV